MPLDGLANSDSLVRGAVVRATRPPPRLELYEWAEEKRVVAPEVSPEPGRWRNDLFSHLIEIMECLAPWHPCESVSFKKSSQVGGTEVGINWIGAIADMWPAPTMIVHPTIKAASDWVEEKWTPTVRVTPCMERLFGVNRRTSGKDKILFKSFPRGFLSITGSNSPADLSSKSIRFLYKEEWDRWELEVGSEGDPDGLADARQTAYHQSGKAKQLRVSTPNETSVSRITPAFEDSDQRHRYVKCPHCGHEQTLHFFPDKEGRGGLRFNTKKGEAPQAWYCCEENGCVIHHHEKMDMLLDVRLGGTAYWKPHKSGPGRQPGFYINALYSPVTTWDKMAQVYLERKDDPAKYKTFVNLWLGEAWEDKGDTPNWDDLFKRRSEYPANRVPYGGLFLTGAADVQKNGIYYEIVAWGPKRISFSIAADFLEGDTSDYGDPVWERLEEVFSRGYVDAFGNTMSLSKYAIDANYNTQQVYAFVRGKAKALAFVGKDGWHLPPVGTPSKQDVNHRGKKIRRGVELWPVAVWGFKSEFYSNLSKPGIPDGQDEDPMGYCYFSTAIHDQRYFKQLTADYRKRKKVRGRMVNAWDTAGENHFHDCRIYNMAVAYHIGLYNLTLEDWERLMVDRGMAPDDDQGDFAKLWATVPQRPPAPTESKPTSEDQQTISDLLA